MNPVAAIDPVLDPMLGRGNHSHLQLKISLSIVSKSQTYLSFSSHVYLYPNYTLVYNSNSNLTY